MFQAREPQESLWQSEFLITPRKAKLMRRSWAEVFRNEALVLIEEERFAPLYSPDMGRPNRAVQTVLGVLVLKEMFDLTDWKLWRSWSSICCGTTRCGWRWRRRTLPRRRCTTSVCG